MTTPFASKLRHTVYDNKIKYITYTAQALQSRSTLFISAPVTLNFDDVRERVGVICEKKYQPLRRAKKTPKGILGPACPATTAWREKKEEEEEEKKKDDSEIKQHD